ncbi:hypothetical protein [Algimonas ampicilliniresistens]|nr:hypothetical protein [Algimonas ampicilliniresistens]
MAVLTGVALPVPRLFYQARGQAILKLNYQLSWPAKCERWDRIRAMTDLEDLEYEAYRGFRDNVEAFSKNLTDLDLLVVRSIDVSRDLYEIIRKHAPVSAWTPNGKFFIDGIEIVPVPHSSK